jgi:hypothetical protein
MAIIPKNSTYVEFCEHMRREKGDAIPPEELDEIYERWTRLNSIQISTGRGLRAMLPADEQHLTNREREAKVVQEAQSQGRNIERV